MLALKLLVNTCSPTRFRFSTSCISLDLAQRHCFPRIIPPRLCQLVGDDEKGLPHSTAQHHHVQLLQVGVVRFQSLYLELQLTSFAIFVFSWILQLLPDGYESHFSLSFFEEDSLLGIILASAHQKTPSSYCFNSSSGIFRTLCQKFLYIGTGMLNSLTL